METSEFTEEISYNERSARVLDTPARPSPHGADGGRARMADPQSTWTPRSKMAIRRFPIENAVPWWRIQFWSHVDQAGPIECWPWTGRRNDAGYGVCSVPAFIARRTGQTFPAHRIAYTLAHGEIPDGLPLDHVCRNPRCCNPSHLEPVTHRENTLRGTSPLAANAKKTHCSRGHEFTPENTSIRVQRGSQTRRCLACRAEWNQITNGKRSEALSRARGKR